MKLILLFQRVYQNKLLVETSSCLQFRTAYVSDYFHLAYPNIRSVCLQAAANIEIPEISDDDWQLLDVDMD